MAGSRVAAVGASPSALEAVADTLRAEGGLLAAALRPDAAVDGRAEPPGEHGRVAAGGAPAAGAAGRPPAPEDALDHAVAVAVAATREAELLHHAPERARLVRTTDRDLALLAGDRLYALGLEALARAGRDAEVGVLSDLVAAVARAHGEAAVAAGAADPAAVEGSGPPEEAAGRAAAAWEVALRALAGSAEARTAIAGLARGA